VKDRINERADFGDTQHPDHRPNYIHLIPLAEIISKGVGQHNPFTQTVNKRWNELVSAFGSEISVLIDVNIDEIARVTAPAITEAIQMFREKKVLIKPGGGGQYGIIELPTQDEGDLITLKLGLKDKQTSLLEYSG
jgi:PHP family Zn ribbon phosphoesterase